jgi:hypothetical protein
MIVRSCDDPILNRFRAALEGIELCKLSAARSLPRFAPAEARPFWEVSVCNR